ncbi:hypothetical protein AHAS_Ahas09G0138300 [Arachis hypogaea]
MHKETKARAGCATWYRRRGTPTQALHYGVPLEGQGVAHQQDKIMGLARQPSSVARWYKFSEKMKEANYMGRATWYRRCGTPFTILHLGVPLEQPGVARQVIQRAKKH